MSDGTIRTIHSDFRLVDLTRDESHLCPHCNRGCANQDGIFVHAFVMYTNQYEQPTRITLDGCFGEKYDRYEGEWFKPRFELIDFIKGRILHPSEVSNETV